MIRESTQQTLEKIRAEHKNLLMQTEKPGDVDLGQVRILLQTLTQAGEIIENIEDRSLLYELIRYWSSFISNRTGEFPATQLQPFDPSLKHNRAKRYLRISSLGAGIIIAVILLLIGAGVGILYRNANPPVHVTVTPTDQTPSVGIITEFPLAGGQPTAITAGPDGNLWFTESQANKIGRITPNGVIAEFTLPTPESQPTAITAGPDGNLWFTQSQANTIGRITSGK